MIGLSPSALILPAALLTLTAGTPVSSLGQRAMLPPAAGEWTRADSVGVYAGKDLFLLVDGGADLFFEYGFVRALTSDYTRPPDAKATGELYEMKDAAAAYGLFTSFTVGTGTAVPIGQEAVLGDGYCIFWKGTYVGMLTVASFDSASEPMLLQLAGDLAREIRHTGELPGLCARLREEGFDSRRMVFIRGNLAVGSQLPQMWASSFPPTEGVVGTSGASRYLILEYADAATAGAALGGASAEWKHRESTVAGDSSGSWRIREHEEWIAVVEQHGRYVLAVSGERDVPEALASLLRRILRGS